MNRNPAKIRQLREKIELKENEIGKLRRELRSQLELVPVGYELIGSGEVVKEGAIAFEPCHGYWGNTYNSVGNILNEQGYVTGITHRGWKYANPIKQTVKQ